MMKQHFFNVKLALITLLGISSISLFGAAGYEALREPDKVLAAAKRAVQDVGIKWELGSPEATQAFRGLLNIAINKISLGHFVSAHGTLKWMENPARMVYNYKGFHALQASFPYNSTMQIVKAIMNGTYGE